MRKIEEFTFRNDFYKWAAGIHLDERSGMSYGFIVRQLPVQMNPLIPFKEAKVQFKKTKINNDFFVEEGKIYVNLLIRKKNFITPVPPVWVLMSRSGSEKTKLDPYRDILKVGLVNGQMLMEIPGGIDITEDYKSSFDTRVILAHSVANAIYASVLKYFNPKAPFAQILQQNGMALLHWHGNIIPELVPQGWFIYGTDNTPVLCSSSQAALFAFKGKERAIDESIATGVNFLGDIHIEPEHGINMSWENLRGLSEYLLSRSLILQKR